MGEGLVGFGHLMNIFTLFNGIAFVFGSIDQLSSKFFNHVFSTAFVGVTDDPTRREFVFAQANFHRTW